MASCPAATYQTSNSDPTQGKKLDSRLQLVEEKHGQLSMEFYEEEKLIFNKNCVGDVILLINYNRFQVYFVKIK